MRRMGVDWCNTREYLEGKFNPLGTGPPQPPATGPPAGSPYTLYDNQLAYYSGSSSIVRLILTDPVPADQIIAKLQITYYVTYRGQKGS